MSYSSLLQNFRNFLRERILRGFDKRPVIQHAVFSQCWNLLRHLHRRRLTSVAAPGQQ